MQTDTCKYFSTCFKGMHTNTHVSTSETLPLGVTKQYSVATSSTSHWQGVSEWELWMDRKLTGYINFRILVTEKVKEYTLRLVAICWLGPFIFALCYLWYFICHTTSTTFWCSVFHFSAVSWQAVDRYSLFADLNINSKEGNTPTSV